MISVPDVAQCQQWLASTTSATGRKCSTYLDLLGCDSGAPPFRLVAPRRQELLRISRGSTRDLLAPPWYIMCDDAGTVPPELLPGGSVQGLYPVRAVPG